MTLWYSNHGWLTRRDRYARLALGSSYAVLQTPSVEEFANGAAFAVQLATPIKRRPDYVYWQHKASVIWAHGSAQRTVIQSTGRDLLKIICQPNYTADKSRQGTIKPDFMAYDIAQIGSLPKGKLEFVLELDTALEMMTLTILAFKTGLAAKATPEDLGSIWENMSIFSGSRCLTTWQDQGAVNAAIHNVFGPHNPSNQPIQSEPTASRKRKQIDHVRNKTRKSNRIARVDAVVNGAGPSLRPANRQQPVVKKGLTGPTDTNAMPLDGGNGHDDIVEDK